MNFTDIHSFHFQMCSYIRMWCEKLDCLSHMSCDIFMRVCNTRWSFSFRVDHLSGHAGSSAARARAGHPGTSHAHMDLSSNACLHSLSKALRHWLGCAAVCHFIISFVQIVLILFAHFFVNKYYVCYIFIYEFTQIPCICLIVNVWASNQFTHIRTRLIYIHDTIFHAETIYKLIMFDLVFNKVSVRMKPNRFPRVSNPITKGF